jgi:hypothetical protein
MDFSEISLYGDLHKFLASLSSHSEACALAPKLPS